MMLKCKVCGKEFEAVKENHYVAREGLKTGAITALASAEEKIFDAFDCPHCGCQYIAGERKREQEVLNEYEEKPDCFKKYEKDDSGCEDCDYKEEYQKNKDDDIFACFGEYEEEVCGYVVKCPREKECKKETRKRVKEDEK